VAFFGEAFAAAAVPVVVDFFGGIYQGEEGRNGAEHNLLAVCKNN
jgi:hypothetical protein